MAQWLAQATHNRLVAGSNPAGPTFLTISNARFIFYKVGKTIPMPTIDYLNGIIETQPPRGLYHYTNSSGLMGILSSKKIWTTKLQYLNDSSEIELALDYFRQEIKDQQKGESRTTRTAEELD